MAAFCDQKPFYYVHYSHFVIIGGMREVRPNNGLRLLGKFFILDVTAPMRYFFEILITFKRDLVDASKGRCCNSNEGQFNVSREI